MEGIMLVGPSRTWRLRDAPQRRHSAGVHAALALAHIDAVLDPGCHYCRGGRYEIPEGGCDHGRRPVSPRDEYLELRKAALLHGIQYHDGGRILSVR
jgi:hypothetical protein